MTSRKPKVPDGLAARGTALWRSTTTSFELRKDELVTLEECCRCVDSIDRMEHELAGAPLTVPGSTPGSLRPHPLLGELRGSRQVLSQMLRLLALSDVPDAEGEQLTPKQLRARRAAQSRWSQRDAVRQRRQDRDRGA